jgi:hypothetical protein
MDQAAKRQSRVSIGFSADEWATWRSLREKYVLTIEVTNRVSISFQMDRGIESADLGIIEAGGRSIFAKYPVLPGGWISILAQRDSMAGSITNALGWWKNQKLESISWDLKSGNMQVLSFANNDLQFLHGRKAAEMDLIVSIYTLGLSSEWRAVSTHDKGDISAKAIVSIRLVKDWRDSMEGGLLMQFEDASVRLNGQEIVKEGWVARLD